MDNQTNNDQANREQKVRELFAMLLQVPAGDIRDDTVPADVERWDSMQHLIMVAGFEEEFGVDVDPEEAIEMYKDFATFKKVVLQKLQGRS